MGNLASEDVRIRSKEQLFGAWFFGIFLVIIASISVYYSFKPMSKMSCYNNNNEMLVNIACSPLNNSNNKERECKDAMNALDKKKRMCRVKKPNRMLLLGILLIPIAIGIILYTIRKYKIAQKTDISVIEKSGEQFETTNFDTSLSLLNKHKSIL